MEHLIQYVSARLYQKSPDQKDEEGNEEGLDFKENHDSDKIAKGVAMGLSGPAPSFAKAAAFLGKKPLKVIYRFSQG